MKLIFRNLLYDQGASPKKGKGITNQPDSPVFVVIYIL
jgi:hypothetical protein